MSSKMANIHDYLEAIGAEPPPIDEKSLAEAKENMIKCDTFEEAVDILQLLDAADDVKEGK
jgi:predicted O-methyltransferase YrrM